MQGVANRLPVFVLKGPEISPSKSGMIAEEVIKVVSKKFACLNIKRVSQNIRTSAPAAAEIKKAQVSVFGACKKRFQKEIQRHNNGNGMECIISASDAPYNAPCFYALFWLNHS